MNTTHDRTGEATLALCADCKTDWACILTDAKTLVCASCWVYSEMQSKPVNRPRTHEDRRAVLER